MKRTPREKLFLAAGIILIAAPFAFGSLRATTTGTDWRYIWAAIAAFAGSSVVIGIGRSRSKTSSVTVGIAAFALIVATLTAVLSAKFMSHTQSVAAWIVAFAFAFCSTVGTVLCFVSMPRKA